MATVAAVESLSVFPPTGDAPILHDLNFSIDEGQRVLLLGPSGAGKSTLLLTLAGVLQQLETFRFEGLVETGPNGLLLQNAMDAWVGETVYRDAAFGAESAAVPTLSIGQLVDAALDAVKLKVDQGRNPQHLSGGELQRLCLAGLLTLAPTLLLLDEPTSMLDAKSAIEVRTAVSQYIRKSGASAVIAEHRFEHWLSLVNRVIILDSTGGIIADGPKTKVLTENQDRLLRWGIWIPNQPAPLTPSERFTRLALEPAGLPEAGSIKALVGPSGSGKTTRLNALLKQTVDTLGPRSIGWVPQNATLSIAGNTVLDSASVTAVKFRGGIGLENTLAWLERLGLADKTHLNPHELSGGEQRRLALATALAHSPTHLFLDEPTVGQDRLNWQFVVSAILEAKASGVQVVLATHDNDLLGFCDTIEQLKVDRTESPSPNPNRNQMPQQLTPLALIGASIVLLLASFFINRLGQALVGLLAVGVCFAAWWRLNGKSGLRLNRAKVLIPTSLGIVSLAFSNWWLSGQPNAEHALLVALRAAFFVIPGVLLAIQIRGSQLADQLGQLVRLPARPVVAFSIALSRITALQETWRSLRTMRNLRGLDLPAKPQRLVQRRLVTNAQNFVLSFRAAGALTAGLLIQAVRSATVTATAMEARGFSNIDEATGGFLKRTWSVPARITKADLVLVGVALGCGLLAALF